MLQPCWDKSDWCRYEFATVAPGWARGVVARKVFGAQNAASSGVSIQQKWAQVPAPSVGGLPSVYFVNQLNTSWCLDVNME